MLRVASLLCWIVLAGAAPAAAGATSPGDATLEQRLAWILDEALPEGERPAAGRELFAAVLASDLFVHQAVGPFDLYVYLRDELSKAPTARKVLADGAKGLADAAALMERHFGREQGLVSGRRFPIVLARSKSGEPGFDELLALLDHCEDGGFSGWKPVNAVWSPANRQAEVVRTWEVQLLNLGHATIAEQKKQWFEHGIGYYALAHVANRLLRKGAWGMAPPWLAQGLIDELDITAFEEAWVGGDWWTQQTPGWFRAGWSGFVPQGASPPPPVTGPPADLAVTVSRSGDSWQHRANSGERHWQDLAADRGSKAPASFAFMAEHESFLPRDRAYARCVLHLMLAVAPGQGASLLELLDTETGTPPSGMPAAEPLTVVFARALGGLPAVDELEAMPMGEMLAHVGRPAIADAIRKHGGEPLLAISDHREQGQWLYRQSTGVMDAQRRQKLFDLILEAEYYQQLHEWKLIGEALDRGAGAALEATRRYPTKDKDVQRVREAFWTGLSGKPVARG